MKDEKKRERTEEEMKKNTQYKKHQNIMRKMHEDILRDKGIYVPPGMLSGTGHHNQSLNPSAVGASRAPGYKMPRKFTLESLGKMDYRQFIPPTEDNQDDFKPSDVIDSDDEMDDDILELYQFNKREEPYTLQMNPNSNSALNLHPTSLNVNSSLTLPGGVTLKRKAHNAVKNHLESVPISIRNKRGSLGRVNQSMIPPQKRKNAIMNQRYINNKKDRTPAKKRGLSKVNKGALTDLRNPKSKSKLMPENAYKSRKGGIPDYSPNRNRNEKLKLSNNKSLVRASDFDRRTKIKQEQKLKNILKLQNNNRLK
jgi:hypothetical protein